MWGGGKVRLCSPPRLGTKKGGRLKRLTSSLSLVLWPRVEKKGKREPRCLEKGRDETVSSWRRRVIALFLLREKKGTLRRGKEAQKWSALSDPTRSGKGWKSMRSVGGHRSPLLLDAGHRKKNTPPGERAWRYTLIPPSLDVRQTEEKKRQRSRGVFLFSVRNYGFALRKRGEIWIRHPEPKKEQNLTIYSSDNATKKKKKRGRQVKRK